MSRQKQPALNLCSFRIEKEYLGQSLVGVDEVGRGCIAGPLVVALVSFPREIWQENLDPQMELIRDSKLLSEKQRELLFDYILEKADLAETMEISAADVDRLNVLRASLWGFQQLVEKVHSAKRKLDIVLVDGNQKIPGLKILQRCIVQGDRFSKTIAAASILAKVTRDRKMKELAKEFPAYGFEKHKGYGTKLHWEVVNQLGASSLHRQSFLGRILKQKVGREGESLVSRFLAGQGFQILHRNWRCTVGEIDIVATKEKELHFIEVRKRQEHNLELSFPNTKQIQMKRTIEVYLTRPEVKSYQCIRSHFVSVAGQEIHAEWDVFQL